MTDAALLDKMDALVHFTKEEKNFVESLLIPRQFKQGEVIVKAGDTARYLMFVNDGYLMTYHTDKEGNEHVIQFARDSWWCAHFYSLHDNAVSPFTTKALSDGEMLLLPRIAHQQLLEKYPKVERYFRLFFQNAFYRLQWRLIETNIADAGQRYHSFIETFPGMEQYVPQKYIASYLGITPEF